MMKLAQNGIFPRINLAIAYGIVNNTNVAPIIMHIISSLLILS